MDSFQLFNKLRTSGKLSKIQVVPANFQNDDVISKYDFETIVNEVHIVFHVLASVHFKESLQSSAETNIKFTGKVLEIAKKVKSLKTFVYVSTVFSNSNKSNVNEEIYDSQLSYQDVISIAGSTGKLEGDKSFALSFQHDFPNVYCLTKHFAEKLVHDQAAELPVAIFRLPIVCPAYKSLPGWTDNINNCTGFFVAASKGLIHAWLGDKNNPWNTAPVDYCVNALTAAAWGASEKYKNEVSPTVPIYNYIFKKNNIPFGMALDYCEEYSQTPFENSIYYNSCIKTKSLFWFSVIFFLTTTIPAALADLLRILTIKKPKYLRLSGQIRTFMIAVSPFSLRKFTFGNHNLKNLLETLKNSENFRNELDFDYENIDWVEFSKNVQPGIKQYFFNEDMNRCGELVKSYKR